MPRIPAASARSRFAVASGGAGTNSTALTAFAGSLKRIANLATDKERQEAILAKARRFDFDRRIRAIEQMGSYRLDRETGNLLNLRTGEIHECREVRRPRFGPVQYVGCKCADTKEYLSPILSAMTDARCGTALGCKHVHIRRLLSGEVLPIHHPVTSEPLASLTVQTAVHWLAEVRGDRNVYADFFAPEIPNAEETDKQVLWGGIR